MERQLPLAGRSCNPQPEQMPARQWRCAVSVYSSYMQPISVYLRRRGPCAPTARWTHPRASSGCGFGQRSRWGLMIWGGKRAKERTECESHLEAIVSVIAWFERTGHLGDVSNNQSSTPSHPPSFAPRNQNKTDMRDGRAYHTSDIPLHPLLFRDRRRFS